MACLTDDQVRSAADLLVAAREQRLLLGGLPEDVTPDSTADMQRIIDTVSERIDRPVRGWKSYSVYKPMNPPVQAPIYDYFTSGSTIPAALSPRASSSPRSCSVPTATCQRGRAPTRSWR